MNGTGVGGDKKMLYVTAINTIVILHMPLHFMIIYNVNHYQLYN